MFFGRFKIFLKRNTYRIEGYRLRSFFNLKNNRFDAFFAKTKLRRFVFRFITRVIAAFKFCLCLKADIHSIDFNLTTKCNLHCENCASLMPYYNAENQWTIDFETFKNDLNKLLLSVNKIYRLKLIGGEPLLVKDLEKMLEYACAQKQIISVIITTNASIIPSDDLCFLLQKYNKKALVELSDYSKNVSGLKYSEIEEKLKKFNIYYFISDYEWFECRNIYKREKTRQELISTYENCFQQPCLSFFDGIIYNCTRAAAINRLTNFKFNSDEIIKIRNHKTKKEEIKNFYTKNYYSFCAYCPSDCTKRVERGIQTKETFTLNS